MTPSPGRHLRVVRSQSRHLSLVPSSGARIYSLPVRSSGCCPDCAAQAPGHGEAA